jgi:hypothetical protein
LLQVQCVGVNQARQNCTDENHRVYRECDQKIDRLQLLLMRLFSTMENCKNSLAAWGGSDFRSHERRHFRLACVCFWFNEDFYMAGQGHDGFLPAGRPSASRSYANRRGGTSVTALTAVIN